MSKRKLFRIEDYAGKSMIKAYSQVPTSYQPKENEFFNFLEAKQRLVSQSGQVFELARLEFEHNLQMDEDSCVILDFEEETEDVEQTTAA